MRAKTVTGVVVLVPIVVTFLALRLVFRWLDALAQPLIQQVFQTDGHIQGLGIVLTIILIWSAGLIASNVFGRRLIGLGHTFLEKLPLIGSIYSPIKQFIEKIAMPQTTGFRQVVLAEYPSDGRWIIGFATGEVELDDAGTMGQCVFVPTSPNPVTGWMVIFPPEKVRKTSMSVEAAMQVIVSAGVVIPPELHNLVNFDLSSDQTTKTVGFGQAQNTQVPPSSKRTDP
ncbi:MAG: DUF502 domain-containing protein [Candidatus Latescibacteria bacterium]|nr:DUF502 domain-containing protein [Candidatus Latescibacterota bacterium]MBT5831977.1 DUF502 domain-containing protein [Candidatus Latescibacterota bacterium]